MCLRSCSRVWVCGDCHSNIQCHTHKIELLIGVFVDFSKEGSVYVLNGNGYIYRTHSDFVAGFVMQCSCMKWNTRHNLRKWWVVRGRESSSAHTAVGGLLLCLSIWLTLFLKGWLLDYLTTRRHKLSEKFGENLSVFRMFVLITVLNKRKSLLDECTVAKPVSQQL